MRVEELAAERLQRARGVDGRDGQQRAPAVDGDLAAPGVHGGDDAFAAYGVRQRLRERQIRPAAVEERRSDDHVRGARLEHRLRARRHSGCRRPTRHGLAAHMRRTRASLLPVPMRRIQIDQLQLLEPRERAIHMSRSSSSSASRSPWTSWTTLPLRRSIEGISTLRLPSLRHPCPYVARLVFLYPGQPDRYPGAAKVRLEIGDAVFGEVKDRCGERGVGARRS